MDNTQSLDGFFSQISIKLDELESIRSKEAKNVNYIIKWSVVVTLVLFIVCVSFPKLVFILGLLVLLLFLLGFYIETVQKAGNELRPFFKKEVIKPLLEYFYDDVRYVPRQRISVLLIIESLLFWKEIQETTGDDYTECRIGESVIHFSEVQLHGRRIFPFWNGVFIAVKFNKTFKTKTLVVPNSKTSFLRKMKLNIQGDMKNASMILLESLEFRKEFAVIAEDQVESRYLLSTSLMQRLMDYKNKVNNNVAFSFVNNWLYVAIPHKGNLFEANIFKPVNDKEFIRTHFEYFQLLTGLVNDLDLNVKIWK